jgi:hypothetical protein
MVRSFVALCLFAGSVGALKADLNDKNFKKSIDGKNAMLFFQAPW